ncbi:MAG: alpha-galactosidase, partial [Verrucomicrobia bacterium]|nr:alpha-galactosidase [Verrucomicrobiota bacterium]
TSQVAVVYELLDQDSFLRRHLEYSPALPQPLRQVEVWRVGLAGECSSQEIGPPEYMRYNVWSVDDKRGFGQPVLLEDTFWGLEFPAGYNHYAEGNVSLTHFPGRTVAGRFVSKTAVLGVAPAGQVARQFRSYIEHGRARPRQPEVQVDYNTWTTVTPATESTSLELIHQFRKNLFEPYGVGFDSFTLDDGWDEKNSLWKLRTSGFPRGFKPLLDALQPMGTRLGLWLSPSSGYEHAGWGGQHGYSQNATFNWFLCQSDPSYRRDICRVVPELIRQNDVGFFKMDGFCASCDTNRHPQHLAGDYAREANVDAFIELITAMRQARPNVYLDPTSGMWLSPWWLWHVDSIWCDTYDGTAPAIVPSANGLDGATTSRDALLRRRLEQNPGFDPGAIETLGVYLDPTLSIEPQTFFENWHDNAMMVAGRGNRLLTFYMNPATFPNPPKDWPFLAGMIQWARHNASTLSHTEMILGDPYRLEPYGYAHFSGKRGILAIRNSFIQPQHVRVKLDASVGWTAKEAGSGPFVASVGYPYRETLRQALRFGDTLELDLEAYQILLLHVEPADPATLPLPGVRCREVNRASHTATWELFALPGVKLSVPVTGLPKAKRMSLDGQAITPVKTRQGRELPLRFGGAKEPCVVEGGSLQADPPGGASRLAGKCHATIPQGAKAFMYVLCLEPSPAEVCIQCRATVNGNLVPIKTIHAPKGASIPARTLKELPLKPWVFYCFEVPEGKSEVAISLQAGEQEPKPFAVQAGWWLWVEQPLEKATLTMEFDQPLPSTPVNPLPFPSALEFQRQVLTLQPLKAFL